MPKNNHKKIGFLVTTNFYPQAPEVGERLICEAKKQGHQTQLLFWDFFNITTGKKVEIYYNKKKFDFNKLDILVPIGVGLKFDQAPFFKEILNNFPKLKIANSLEAILKAKNKSLTSICLTQAGVPNIPSAITFSEFKLSPTLKHLNDNEYVCKLTDKAFGKGVAYLHTRRSFISNLELLKTAGIDPIQILWQKFIKESGGKDYRVFVVGNKAVASITRTCHGDDFRSNVCGSGTAENKEAPAKALRLAEKATRALGLAFAGVDVLVAKQGPLIIEVNSNPAFNIEKITQVNVPAKIIKFITK